MPQAFAIGPGLQDVVLDDPHGCQNGRIGFVTGEPPQTALRGQLDVDPEAVSMQAGLLDQALAGIGNALQMDIAVEALFSEQPHRPDQMFHGSVRTSHDARTEEKPLDVVAAVEISGQRNDFFGCKGRPRHIIALPIYAIGAVIDAIVCQQDLEQRYAAPIFSVAVADPAGRCIAQPLAGVLAPASAGGTRNVIFGSVCQYG